MATLELLFAQIQKFSPDEAETLASLRITKAVNVFHSE
jgi:hypothetical protein